MYKPCDVLCSRCQDVPAVALTVLACGVVETKDSWPALLPTQFTRRQQGMPCELFWSQECRQHRRLFRALWWPVPLAGFLRGLFCSLYKMPKAFDQPPVLGAWTVEVCLTQFKGFYSEPHHLKLHTVNLESRVTFCPPCLGSLAYSLYKIVLFF